ncbi:hypothetical protein PG995_004240 [Apiospora arundinis]
MRLLQTGQYKLFEATDIPSPFPQYAILSHTWISPKEEITYQDFKQRRTDLENGVYKQNGWAKLQKYCDRAARDGWEWAWMDTCCIDKTNPADTSESINAMFRWYQSADICYAYLDDVRADEAFGRSVPVDCDLDDIANTANVANLGGHFHDALTSSLISANWFTRGWTLQELLAPPYLVFVDQSWRRIGTRESWSTEIRKASRIEARHLTHFTPTDFTSCSIAMRLSWASRRNTTVEEDESYSLLGLFGISLPLIYGEGKWRAFNRLQNELIKVYNDDSIFAWKFDRLSMRRLTGSKQAAHGQGIGILAPSIREYWDASYIEAFPFYGSSFSMTNKGLKFNTKRWRHKDDLSRCIIRLNCGLDPNNRLAIPLEHVDDTYDRVQPDIIYDQSTIRPDQWEEDFSNVPDLSKRPAVIRASNYSDFITTSSIFSLEYPDQIKIGKKYFVDFDTSIFDTQLILSYEDQFKQNQTKKDLTIKPSRLVFINIELQSETGPNPQFDVIVNLSERGFPSVGIISRGQEPWERLGDPLDERISKIYEGLADHLHYKVAIDPAYPVIAVAYYKNAVVSVILLPRPRQRTGLQEAAKKGDSTTSKEYSIKIRVGQKDDRDPFTAGHSSKRRYFYTKKKRRLSD